MTVRRGLGTAGARVSFRARPSPNLRAKQACLLNSSIPLTDVRNTAVLRFLSGVEVVRGAEGIIFTWVRRCNARLAPPRLKRRTAAAAAALVHAWLCATADAGRAAHRRGVCRAAG